MAYVTATSGMLVLFAGVALFVVFGLVVFVTALWDGEHTSPGTAVAAAECDQPAEISQAFAAGMQLRYVGRRRDAYTQATIWLMAPPDGTVLLNVYQVSIGRLYIASSLLADDSWLITSSGIQRHRVANSRLNKACFYGASLGEVLDYHALRLAGSGQEAISSATGDCTQAFLRVNHQLVTELVNAGRAQWNAGGDGAKTTLLGAWIQALPAFVLPITAALAVMNAAAIRWRLRRTNRRPYTVPGFPVVTSGPQLIAPHLGPGMAYVICYSRPDGSVNYLEYLADGQLCLPVFSTESSVQSYAPAQANAPGQQMQITPVERAWLLTCLQRGYTLVLDPHLTTRRRLTVEELTAAAR